MDDKLKNLMDMATLRGSKYIKGECGPDELPEKVAELGAFLLEKAKKLQEVKGDNFREELIDVQNKVDDMRKCIFANKFVQR